MRGNYAGIAEVVFVGVHVYADDGVAGEHMSVLDRPEDIDSTEEEVGRRWERVRRREDLLLDANEEFLIIALTSTRVTEDGRKTGLNNTLEAI